MDSPPPDEPIPQTQARTLLASFTTFLTLTIHTVLYHRHIYPPETFLLAKHHNLPVHQSRHPGLCEWINDSVTQVRELLAHGRLDRVSINLHQFNSLQVVERWVFDVSSFPSWVDEEAEKNRQAAAAAKGKGKEVVRPLTWEERGIRERKRHKADERTRDELERQGAVNWIDVDESMRGALRRIAYAAEAKGPMQDGTFTVAVELRDSKPGLLVVSYPCAGTHSSNKRSNPRIGYHPNQNSRVMVQL